MGPCFLKPKKKRGDKERKFTPWKFNIAPEKWWLEDYFPIGKVTFQGRTVKLREGICFNIPAFGFQISC